MLSSLINSDIFKKFVHVKDLNKAHMFSLIFVSFNSVGYPSVFFSPGIYLLNHMFILQSFQV